MNQALDIKTTPVNPDLSRCLDQLNSVIVDKDNTVRLAMTCLLAQGHLLLQDIPGTGKTVFANALAKVCDLQSNRVQFTNDLLPADITGVSIFNVNNAEFTFHPGPIFTNLLLADEINRATPKSQSALLEAMEEQQISIEGITRPLAYPFFIIATQNPFEQKGVYPLPEAQLDRFLMCLSLGYVSKPAELALLSGQDPRKALTNIPSLLSAESLLAMQSEVSRVTASSALIEYVHALLDYTRHSGEFAVGLSTRAGFSLLAAARAWAYLHGQDKVIPSDVQAVFVAVATHRLTPVSSLKSNYQSHVQGVLDVVSIP